MRLAPLAPEDLLFEQRIVRLADRNLPHGTARRQTLAAAERGADAKREKKLAQPLRDVAIRLVDPIEVEGSVVAPLAVVEPSDERGTPIVVDREYPIRDPQFGGGSAEGLREEASCANL
jgi:hypothetical protein